MICHRPVTMPGSLVLTVDKLQVLVINQSINLFSNQKCDYKSRGIVTRLSRRIVHESPKTFFQWSHGVKLIFIVSGKFLFNTDSLSFLFFQLFTLEPGVKPRESEIAYAFFPMVSSGGGEVCKLFCPLSRSPVRSTVRSFTCPLARTHARSVAF